MEALIFARVPLITSQSGPPLASELTERKRKILLKSASGWKNISCGNHYLKILTIWVGWLMPGIVAQREVMLMGCIKMVCTVQVSPCKLHYFFNRKDNT